MKNEKLGYSCLGVPGCSHLASTPCNCSCHKTKPESSWEERFDKEFQTKGQAHHYEFCLCGEGDENKCEQDIKTFIQSELDRQAQEVRKQVLYDVRRMIFQNIVVDDNPESIQHNRALNELSKTIDTLQHEAGRDV